MPDRLMNPVCVDFFGMNKTCPRTANRWKITNDKHASLFVILIIGIWNLFVIWNLYIAKPQILLVFYQCLIS
jgi:hypothetical protein